MINRSSDFVVQPEEVKMNLKVPGFFFFLSFRRKVFYNNDLFIEIAKATVLKNKKVKTRIKRTLLSFSRLAVGR